jgi:hypothetical protein
MNLNKRRRHGFSLLEFEMALIVLGIALSGLFPLVVMHSRGLQLLEERYAVSGQWYVAPSADIWARKLGAAAALVRENPGPLPALPKKADYEVQVTAFKRSLDSEEVAAQVLLTPALPK